MPLANQTLPSSVSGQSDISFSFLGAYQELPAYNSDQQDITTFLTGQLHTFFDFVWANQTFPSFF
jgi:hypothetical protein